MLKKYLEQLKKVNPKAYLGVLVSIGAIAAGSQITPETVPEVKPNQVNQISEKLARIQSQRDNKYQPHRTCNTSANAMFLDFYRDLMVDRPQWVDDDDYLDSVMKRGDTTVHEVQTAALKAWGLNTFWDTSGSRKQLIDQVSQGYPTVVNILHRGRVEGNGIGALRGGHMIVLRFYDPVTQMFDVSDPYGNLAKGYPSGLGASAGKYKMSKSEFYTRWQGGRRELTVSQKKAFNL